MVKQYLDIDPWSIVESSFHPEFNRVSESVFSLGNGYMGQRGCFEETYSGPSHRGVYLAGVYYPDPTVVGWWKIGYPDYYGKIIHGLDWVPIEIYLNDQKLDMAACRILDFKRCLNMKCGTLSRRVHVEMPDGCEVQIHSERFVSLAVRELGAIRYRIKALKGDVQIRCHSVLSAEDKNQHSENEFLHRFQGLVQGTRAFLSAQTRKLDFKLMSAIAMEVGGDMEHGVVKPWQLSRQVGHHLEGMLRAGQELVISKFAISCSSRTHHSDRLQQVASELLEKQVEKGYDRALESHRLAWAERWKHIDIEIDGDPEIQQGIRFNLFQLYQSFDGRDPELNISPKGFTGEVYGGGTYWDTEAFCLPYVLGTHSSSVARHLLEYRYRQLPKAIENASKLGFKEGAALFPMVTFNGEECHNEWEITFEEIHRNSAIAYAIHQYVDWTGDEETLWECGVEMFVAIARFWAQRVNFSEAKQAYVILGVTGPNEYENNVNNNWYTNIMASWTLRTTLNFLNKMETDCPERYSALLKKVQFRPEERTQFQTIADNMYEPFDAKRAIYLQQDGYLDKELLSTEVLSEQERPISQNWSWDRILRSCFVKQADVLQGLFFLKDRFSLEDIRRNFAFYEPKTVHESSLSPSLHAAIAAWIGETEKARDLLARSVRMDLDDINNDTEHGCHITSMGGSWLAVFQGVLGIKCSESNLSLEPKLPASWDGIQLSFIHQGRPWSLAVRGLHVRLYSEFDNLAGCQLQGRSMTKISKGEWEGTLDDQKERRTS